MEYLSQEEKDSFIQELRLFCKDLSNKTLNERKSFLLDYTLYAREFISQEWFNIFSIIKHIGNKGICNSVVKWNEIFIRSSNSPVDIRPRKGTHGISVIVPAITQELNLKRNINELKLQWYRSYVFSIDMLAIPPMLQTPAEQSIMEMVTAIGCNSKLDEKVEIQNMVDWIDINNFINCFLNEIINDRNTGLLNQYSRTDFHFYFELLKYLFVACTDFYDSDDVQESSVDIPDILTLKEHDLLLVFHDICFMIRRFTVFLAEYFKRYTDYELSMQEERYLNEQMQMNIKERIAFAKSKLEESEEQNDIRS